VTEDAADLFAEGMLDDLAALALPRAEESRRLDAIIEILHSVAADHFATPDDHEIVRKRARAVRLRHGGARPTAATNLRGARRELPKWVYKTLLRGKLRYKVYILRLIYGGAWKTVGQAERVRDLIVAEMTPGRPTGEVLRAADAIVKAERERLRIA
jgi:hypothetical protein